MKELGVDVQMTIRHDVYVEINGDGVHRLVWGWLTLSGSMIPIILHKDGRVGSLRGDQINSYRIIDPRLED